MPFKTIFWDNDGTLVNTEPAYFEATRKVLAELGVELTEEWYSGEQLKKGASSFALLADKNLSDEALADLRLQRNACYTKLLKTHVEVLPGVVATLEKLHGKIPMGIVTTSRRFHFELIMQSTDLGKFFDFSICLEDVTRAKPDPEPYLKAWQRSGLKKEDCLAIEDSERGVIAAKAAGLTCFAIPNELTKTNDFSKADRVLKSVEEISDLLNID